MEIFVFDSSNYETFKLCYYESIHQNAAPSTWTYVLLQAVAGMAKESLCYPNPKHTKMDIHRFDSSAASLPIVHLKWTTQKIINIIII